MFENLTNKLENIFSKLKSAPSLTEEQVDSGLKEIRLALLEADVALPVTKEFIANVKPKAIGKEIIKSTSAGQMIVKIVYDELVNILGSKNEELNFKAVPPVSLLLVGLQGSGKTTSAAKLAKNIEKNYKKKVMVVSLDVYRPAAQEQLKLLAEANGIQCLPIVEKQQPIDITKRALNAANLNGSDVIIFDTAGRTNIDEALLNELRSIFKLTKPTETLLVTDAMIGQESINVAKAFSEYVDITGVVLTRVDGDAKGGVALSMSSTTGKPIKFLGVGEKVEQIEVFSAKRIAGRILDMGDIVGMVEKAEQEFDEKEAEVMANKLAKGNFDLEDFKKQIYQMQKLGGIKGILSMLPGVRKAKKALENSNLEDKTFLRMCAIISSMTKKEKKNPKIINGSRKKRIANGSGVDIQDVNRLLKQFKNMQIMMKKMNKHGMSGLEKMMGNNFNSSSLESIYSNLKR